MFLCIVGYVSVFGQPFLHDIRKQAEGGAVSFEALGNVFHQWAKGKDLRQMKGWKSFYHWYWFYEQRLYPYDYEVPHNIYYQQLKRAEAEIPRLYHQKSSWVSLSPAVVPEPMDTIIINGMGRINCIEFHPYDPQVFWVGTSQGGVWKTTDGGQSWIPLTDNLPVLSISDIAVNPLNPNVLYIATGDIEYIGYNTIVTARPTIFGMGVLKTTDGGHTWDTTGLSYHPSQTWSLIRKILVHPSDTSVVIACGVDGVYRSEDGGQTWVKTQTGVFVDMEQNPLNPNTIYIAGFYQPGWGSSGARVYKTTDFGQTWQELQTTIPVTGQVLRTKLAIAPSDTNRIYALSCGYSGGFHSFHRSLDGGQTWEVMASRQSANKAPNMLGWYDGDYFGISIPGFPKDTAGQGTYDLTMLVNKSNADLVYTGGVNLWGTTNAGTGGSNSTWNIVSFWMNMFGHSIHADQHCMRYHPLTGEIFVGNDGGLYKTDTVKIGNLSAVLPCLDFVNMQIIPGCYQLPTQWTYLSNGIHNTEFYRLALSRADKHMILGGTQDNGSWMFRNGTWRNVYGADGMEAMAHHHNPDVLYVTIYYGGLQKSTDGGQTFMSGLEAPITDAGENGDWITPFVMDPLNPDIIYAGFQNVWKSTDGGITWTKISNFGNNQPIRALAVAPTAPWYIYAARKGSIFCTKDGGNTWQNISLGLPLMEAMITYIAVDYYNPERAWVTISGFKDGKKVYRTTNAGQSWENISYNLPNVPVNCIVHQAGYNQQGDTLNGLYIGTDIGVFYTNDELLQTSQPWQWFNGGLPGVIVTELEIQYEAQKIVAATYGRGIWESPLYEETFVDNLMVQPVLFDPIFKIFPNPVTDRLYVQIQGISGTDLKYFVFDATGRVVVRSKHRCEQQCDFYVDVQHLLHGKYTLVIYAGNGIYRASFVKAGM